MSAESIARLCEVAEASFPTVRIARDVFARYLASHAAGAEPSDEGVRELWLACGIRAGNAEAIRAFEERYVRGLDRALARMRLAASEIDELKQLVRQKLLVPGEDGAARVEEYAGRGRLAGLVQVAATREALTLLRRAKRDVPLAEDALAAPGAWDPGMEMLKGKTREAFREAFARAVSALEPRQRNLLRLHLLGGVTLEQLAEVYSVHRATIVRWLAGAREAVLSATKAGMRDALAIEGDELESLMGDVQSRLDVSIERLLATRDQ